MGWVPWFLVWATWIFLQSGSKHHLDKATKNILVMKEAVDSFLGWSFLTMAFFVFCCMTWKLGMVGLNKNGAHRYIGWGAIRRYVLVGVDVSLLEEECGLRGLRSSSSASVSLSLPLARVDQDVELSCPSPAPCLPAGHHASCHDNRLSFWTVRYPPVKCFPLWKLPCSWCLFIMSIEILIMIEVGTRSGV